MNIRVPALRERPEEIPILVEYFLAVYGRKHGRDRPRVEPAALERFVRYSWPGNIRELENIIQRIVVLGTDAVVAELGEAEVREETSAPGTSTACDADDGAWLDDSRGLKEVVRRAAEIAERRALKRALERVRWRRVVAAQRLGISYKTLLEKIKHYRLDAPDS